jgi:predicted Zn-ribbon and HTH transcriptional regulator
MNNIEAKEVCDAARQIQEILNRKGLELVVWPNVENKNCIWIIQKGKNPWEGARVSTLKD